MCFPSRGERTVDSGAREAAQLQLQAQREDTQFQRELLERQLTQQQTQRDQEAQVLNQARQEREAELAAEDFRKEQARIEQEERDTLQREAATAVGGTDIGKEDISRNRKLKAATALNIKTAEDDQQVGFDPLTTKPNILTAGLGFNTGNTGGKKF